MHDAGAEGAEVRIAGLDVGARLEDVGGCVGEEVINQGIFPQKIHNHIHIPIKQPREIFSWSRHFVLYLLLNLVSNKLIEESWCGLGKSFVSLSLFFPRFLDLTCLSLSRGIAHIEICLLD